MIAKELDLDEVFTRIAAREKIDPVLKEANDIERAQAAEHKRMIDSGEIPHVLVNGVRWGVSAKQLVEMGVQSGCIVGAHDFLRALKYGSGPYVRPKL